MGKSVQRFAFLGLAGVMLLVTGCSTAPFTGRRQLMMTSASEENALGYQSFAEIRQKYPVSRDPRITGMVTRVGERISQAAKRPDFKWEFVVFQDDKMVNAFCLPGGKVGIFTGILKYTQDEAGMAVVISHEVAHALLRHAGERMSQATLTQLGGVGLGVAMGGVNPYAAQVVQQLYGLGTTVGVLLPYSRTQEYEADEVGLILMAKAGYDPEAAVGFWQRMMAGKKGKEGRMEFLSTHPTDGNRIAQIHKLAPGIRERYGRPTEGAGQPPPAGPAAQQPPPGAWRKGK